MATRFTFTGKRKPSRVKCIAYPTRRRRRIFTPKKVGAIICDLLRGSGDGVDIAPDPATLRRELRREVDRCFPCGEGDEQKQNALQQAVAVARQAINENATVIAIALSVLLAILVVPRLLTGAPPALLALIPFAVRQAITQVPGIVARLRAQQAANGEFFRRVSGL